MQFPLTFDRPWLLLLLPGAIWFFWALSRRSYAGQSQGQTYNALLFRCGVSALLVLSLAGLHVVHRTSDMTTLYLVDVSDSVAPEQRAAALEFIRQSLKSKRGKDAGGLIVFGKDSYLETPPTPDFTTQGFHASVQGGATDIASALRTAASSFPEGSGRKIVLFTDGNENSGSAAAEVATLRAQGVVVDIAPTALGSGKSARPEAMVDNFILPRSIREEAPFQARVIVSSTVAQTATLTFKRDGQSLSTQTITLQPGKNVAVLDCKEQDAGLHRYDVSLKAPFDTVPENNESFATVFVQGKPRVLYIADKQSPGATSLQNALKTQGIGLDIRSAEDSPATMAGLLAYDSIIVSDVGAPEFSPDQLQAFQRAAQDFGVGFGMIGGPNSFAAGTYSGTPVEEALPVSMNVRRKKRLPAADVVIVLDASGSMAATENGVEKVQLGARAAVNLMKALQPDDRVAVLSVTTEATIVVPLQSAAKAASAAKAVEAVSAGGGGIYCRAGLEAAYTLLETSNAPIKHVILVPDTTDSEQQDGCVNLAATMRRSQKITTSVCGIGKWGDIHVPFQKDVAKAGGGQLFVANQATSLPQFFERDMQAIQQSLFVEHPFRPAVDRGDPVVAGVGLDSAPPLLGYNLVSAKPTATVPMLAPVNKDPIFAYWRYGLGRTFAFTSDDRPHWAAQWLGWPGYTRFWSRVARWSLKSNESGNFQTEVENTQGKGRVVVDAFDQTQGYLNNASFVARVIAPDLSTRQVVLNQTAPGRYEASFNASATGSYLLNVRDLHQPQGGQSLSLAVPYSPEYRNLTPNLPLLKTLAHETGGRLLVDPAQVFDTRKFWKIGDEDWTFPLLLLAAFLFLIDVAYRRIAWKFRPNVVAGHAKHAGLVAGDLVQAGLLGPPKRYTRPAPMSKTNGGTRRGKNITLADDDYLANPTKLRNAIDDDDPFPFVASLQKRDSKQEKTPPPPKA